MSQAMINAGKVMHPEQEPVGWQYREANDDGTWRAWIGCDKRLAEDHWRQVRAIYTTPPKRPWVELTDEEIETCRERAFSTNNPYCPVDKKSMWKAYQYLEAKLKSKNA